MADAGPPAAGGSAGSSASPPQEAPERYRLLDWRRFREAGASDSAQTPEDAVIGAGAMGRVLLALDERMGRVVAIKELLPAPSGRLAPRGRFLREARVTGALEHPGIVPVHEIGVRADRAPYYTMRLVRGRSLAAALGASDGLRGRLALLPHVVDLCHAVAFAHSQGVIHRDLKPDNIMVGEFGETVVLDWGLASGLDAEPGAAGPSRASLAGATSPSRTVGVMGTPAFMSPQQAWGRPGEVDEASDIWALGAILYQLLTGTLPVPGKTAQQNLDWLRDDSKQVQPVRARCRQAPRELASVAMACLVRDKEQRMASAQQVARELERWQAGERVVAHRYSVLELASHVVNRNRPLSVAVGLGALAVVAAVGLSVAARQARQEAEALGRQYAFEQLLLAREALDGQRPLEAEARLRASLEQHDTLLARALWARIQATPLLMRQKLETEVTGLAFSPDGQRLAVAAASPDLVLLDSWTGARRTLAGPERDLYVVAWSPGGDMLAAGSGGGEVVLWTDLDQPPFLLPGHGDIVSALAFERGGGRLLSGSFDGDALLWDLETRRPVQSFEGHTGPITAIAWNPWGGSFATASADQTVRTWDLDTGGQRLILEGHQAEVTGLAYLEGGGALVTAGYDGALRSWDLATGELLAVRGDPSAQFTILGATSSGGMLAAGDEQGRLHLWSPASAVAARVIQGGRSAVFALALDRDGARIASGGIDRSVSLWNTASTTSGSLAAGHEGVATAVDYSPDGQRVVSAGWDGVVRTWDRHTGEQLAAWTAHVDTIETLRVSPDGGSVATGGADHSVRIHDLATGELRQLLTGHYGAVRDLAFGPDGAQLASAGAAGMVYLWDLGSGARRTILDQRSPTAVAFGPHGRLLAVGWTEGDQGEIRVVELPDGQPVFEASAPGLVLSQLAFAPDGRHVHGISRDAQVWSWDLAGGAAAAPLQLEGRGRAVRADSTGRWLAASSTVPAVGLLDLADGSSTLLRGHRGPVAGLAFDPSAPGLATAGFDGTVRTWDPVSGLPAWYGSALLPYAGLRHSHRGWEALDGLSADEPDSAWYVAIHQRGRLAEQLLNKSTGCLLSWDGVVELWDLRQDRLVSSVDLGWARGLVAMETGCGVQGSDGAVHLLGPAGATKLDLVDAPLALGLGGGGDDLLLAYPGELQEAYGRGGLSPRWPLPFAEPTVVGPYRSGWVVGERNGGVYGEQSWKDGSRGSFRLQDTPTSAVSAIADGPRQSIAVGYADGTVGLWDTRSGTRLLSQRLHGAVRLLVEHDDRLHALTEVGAYTSIDLGVLSQPRCALLQEIWERVSVCWDGGAQACEPPADHPCMDVAD